MFKKLFILLMLVSITACDSTSIDDADDYFAGRNVTYLVATGAGGGYDAYARLISRYMAKYLGAGNIIISNVPGAGHIVGANTLWKARPDGLTMGTFNAGLIYNQIVGRQTMQFKMEEFAWIGKAAGEPRSLIVSASCQIKTMEDLIASMETVKFSSAGVGSASFTDTKLLAEAFDLNIQVIPGFDGTEGEMAMMRGEVCAQFGTTSSLKPFVDSGYGSFIMTIGGEIEGVPNGMSFATTERAREIVELMETLAQLGRITAAPPNTPFDRLQVLQDAYRQALEDPELLAEAEKLGFPIEFTHGDEVKRMIIDALDQKPEIAEVIGKVLNLQ